MSDRRSNPDAVDLNPEDRAFVDRLSNAYAAPEMSPARRVAFRKQLDRRTTAPRGAKGLRWVTAGLVATLAAVLLLTSTSNPPSSENVPAQVALEDGVIVAPDATLQETTPEEALFSLAFESQFDEASDLPDDYEAIASLFLGS
jgi:hypothetical protein